MNKKNILTCSLIVVAIIVLIISKMYIIGSKSYTNIEVRNVSLSRNNEILIEASINNKKEKFKSFSYILVGKELYVTTKTTKTLKVNEKEEIKIEIPVSLNNVEHIHLTDDKTTKVIYSK